VEIQTGDGWGIPFKVNHELHFVITGKGIC